MGAPLTLNRRRRLTIVTLALLVLLCLFSTDTSFITDYWRERKLPSPSTLTLSTNPLHIPTGPDAEVPLENLSSSQKDQRLNAQKLPLNILYVNTHDGTRRNIRGVAAELDISVDEFDVGHVARHGSSWARSKKLIDSGFAAKVCEPYEAVLIGDTVPHARFLFESLLHKDPAKHCNATIIIEMTNRFDWEILNPAPYYRNLRAILMNPGLSNRVVWVANNPFEAFYLEEKLGIPSLSERVSVIHPLGLSGVDFTYPDSLPPPSKSHFAIRAFYCGRIHSLLAKKIPLTIIPVASHYGGPQALVKFKGYIDFPYQYSTMKLYENLASNVDVFIPTPRLLEELIKKDTHCSSWISIPTVKDLSKKHLLTPAPTFPPWSALFDFYNPLFAPYIHYFDTLEELSVISSVEKKGGKEFYADYRREILQKWRRVLEQVHRRTSS